MNIFDEIINKDSNRFQEGLFTGFYIMKTAGLTQDKIFKIFDTLENNNTFDCDDYKNLKENFIKYCEEYDSARKLFSSIKED